LNTNTRAKPKNVWGEGHIHSEIKTTFAVNEQGALTRTQNEKGKKGKNENLGQ
jgi:hypothetical protein